MAMTRLLNMMIAKPTTIWHVSKCHWHTMRLCKDHVVFILNVLKRDMNTSQIQSMNIRIHGWKVCIQIFKMGNKISEHSAKFGTDVTSQSRTSSEAFHKKTERNTETGDEDKQVSERNIMICQLAEGSKTESQLRYEHDMTFSELCTEGKFIPSKQLDGEKK